VTAADIQQILRRIDTKSFNGIIVRCIPQLDFQDGNPPRYLFVSGKKNRCNPANVECVYFSENEDTANAEFRLQWEGTKAEHQPKLTFRAGVNLTRVFDLADQKIARKLDLIEADFFEGWRKKSDTILQALGRVLSQQSCDKRISALRFPSNAAHRQGATGCNWVIFKTAVQRPDSVKILGRSGDPIEIWPEEC